ncbi:hypothetical protein J2Y69_002481 [Microbacterium resistens]|uniref:YqaJ viral recombinase domain-containing protein n=1 Tax=Microbacterium resistens TaxID=156977 RepID=A0ABU1SF30_9MICO|nr:YqaJ viral recombinase family protein [Microbacterium resistens]MDR6867873.1 hypothetical protein [Microbacterium resistens]
MPIALVSSDDEENWKRARADGGRRVTATDAARLVGAGIDTWRTIHREKTTEAKFLGNAATERGHRLEPVVQAWVEAHLGIPPANMLYIHSEWKQHGATPDCALEDEGEWSIAEIKTTTEDWSHGVPKRIVRQILWQAHVMSAGYAVLVWWRVDDAGQPLTLNPSIVEIPIDADEIGALIAGADAYLAWVEAGCPEYDEESDLPVDIVQAIADMNRGAAAEKRIRAWLDDHGPVKKTLPVGSIAYVVSEGDEFDKAGFLKANPDAAAVIAKAAQLLKDAGPAYRKPKVSTRLTITPPKEEAA